MDGPKVVELSDGRRLKSELAYETLLLEIICGSLRPGQAVDELSLSEDYGMPRAGVRDALLRLALEGLVDRRPRLGTVVADIGAIELQQIFALRVQLEGSAAALAATHATKRDVAALHAAFYGVDEVIAKGDHRALIAMDLAFHRALGEATHNRWLAKVTNTLLLSALRFWHHSLTRRTPETLRAEIDDHLKIADAIAIGDPEVAQLAMREVLAEFPSTVRDSFDASIYRAPVSRSENLK